MDCLNSNWISSKGSYVHRFEGAFAEFCGVRHAVSCSSGTAALHLALLAVGVGQGDEVIVPTLTFVATANAVTYCGARPVFVDSEAETWNMDPNLIEAKITPRTKAIIAVHLYGHPVDMDPVFAIARRHHLFVIEDASQAHGAQYKGRTVGSLGDIGTFSFYGNKNITTGEGGMVVTNDHKLAKRVAQLRGQGVDPERTYWFPIVGYNYRMTNIAAAIGLAQLEKIEWHLERRREVAMWYQELLKGVPDFAFQLEKPWARHAFWMVSFVFKNDIIERDAVSAYLAEEGIETRPIFYPVHTLPPYQTANEVQAYPIAERIARHGISLPTWAGLKRQDVQYICNCMLEYLAKILSTIHHPVYNNVPHSSL